MFYQSRITKITPARIPGRTARETLSYRKVDGAKFEEIPFLCELQPRKTEIKTGTGNRRTTVNMFALFTPPGETIDANRHTRVLIGGRQYTIVGEPRVWPDLFDVDHCEITLELVNE